MYVDLIYGRQNHKPKQHFEFLTLNFGIWNFLDLLHKSFLDQVMLDLRNKKWAFLNQVLPEYFLYYVSVNNTSVCKYWKVLLYPTNTDTGTFYWGSTDIDTDAQYPKFHTDILVLPVFYSISILCFKPPFDSCYLRLLAL